MLFLFRANDVPGRNSSGYTITAIDLIGGLILITWIPMLDRDGLLGHNMYLARSIGEEKGKNERNGTACTSGRTSSEER